MQITGSYQNYVTMSNLLAPLGVKGSSDMVVQTFTSALRTLEDQINQKVFSEESTVALEQFYDKFSDLAAQAQKLTTTDTGSVFNDRTATSSNSGVVTATAFNAFSPETGAVEATYNISVTQLAQAQENSGLEFNAADLSTVNAGTNTFNIHVNGQDHELLIDVQAGDTNEVVLQKMETAINTAGIGVTAAVKDGSVQGTQQLAVTADETGAAASFSISDVAGNAVSAIGVDSVSTAAQDAEYRVDGTDLTSGSNAVYLDGGMVAATLQGEGDSVLTVAPDASKIQNAVTDFISGLNSSIDFLAANSDYINDNLVESLNSFIAGHKNELSALGITQGEDGTLVIDGAKLATSVSENPSGVKAVFSESDGLASEVNNFASRTVLDSPLNYAKEAESLSQGTADFLYDASSNLLQGLLAGTLLNLYT